MQCVVLAGGLGTRMSRFTRGLPKALIPVRGEPFIRHQLRLLAAHGIDDVVISTGYLGDKIDAEVERHHPDGMLVRCVSDGPELLGTAGALRRVADLGFLDDPFMVVYGDSYLPISYGDLWRAFDRTRYSALMAVLRNVEQLDASNVVFERDTVRLYRKGVLDPEALGMHHVDYGISILTTDVLATVPPLQPHDLATLFEGLSVAGALQGVEMTQRFFEVGSERGLADLESELARSTNDR